ncbi:hypothetical protein LSCM1_01367 [Leishmania martiniquensis]|uniref:C2 domain-containing protein n=1 Tax=Leishmania martiniquensis TaxID=1580590 RepID=A0A836KMK8_9TRYP|nr:hypothetical protein LSCM1_01367 [Leishmania martiniquensis]
MGRIELTVCAARNLYSHRLSGLPDTFVRVSMGEKKYKTRVVKRSLNPEWDETFRFQVADELSAQVRLEVWCKRTYSDDLLGYYTLSLGGLTKGVVKDKWYLLERSKTEAGLHVRLLAVDFGAIAKPEEQWMVTEDIGRDPVKRALEGGTYRPGLNTVSLRTEPPQAYALPAPALQKPQTQKTEQQQQPVIGIPYVAAPPQPVMYASQQPPPGYYQACPPPQSLGYYPPSPPPPLQSGYYPQALPPYPQGYYTPAPPPAYAPQPHYQY